MSRVLKPDSVNKIKSERAAEFGTSIFSEVYQSAAKVVREIINSNKEYKTWQNIDKFCNENQISNVISFLGERGMGKSSAMLSFAFYLKEYYKEKKKVANKYRITGNEGNEDFYVLPKIDAAMMGAGENLFEIVLAKMWDDFKMKENHLEIKDDLCKVTKDRFSRVKRSYMEYRSFSKDNEKLTKGSQLTELHDLSKSLNLREDFTKLVKDFLKCVEIDSTDNYLVVCIDDLDIVKVGTYDILEQMRLFFTIPKVIVLVTADINRLILDISSIFSEQLLYSSKIENSDVKMVQRYAHNYLAKILPRNMRIYMPLFNAIDGALILKEAGLIKGVYKKTPEYMITEKRYTMDIIAKYTGVLLYPEITTYSNEYKSLRNIVNNVDELTRIVRQNDNIAALYQWIQKQLFISCKNIESADLRKFVQILLRTGEDMCNYYIVNWSFHEIPTYKPHISNPGYGRVICQIAELEKECFQESEFFWILIWIYSVLISKMFYDKRDEDIAKEIIRDDIFDSAMVREGKTGWGYSRNVAPLLQMRLDNVGSIKDIMVNNSKLIVDIFKALLLCDIDSVINKLEVEDNLQTYNSVSIGISLIEESGQQKLMPNTERKVEIRFKKIDSRCSIDNFLRNIIDYDKKWDNYLKKIYKELSKVVDKRADVSENSIAEIKCEIQKENNINIELFAVWKKDNNINKITDILPFQSVGVMLEIAKELNSFTNDNDTISIENLYKSTNIIVKNLENSEKQYPLSEIDREDLKYSEKMKGILKIINMQSISTDRFDKLFRVANEASDSTIL